MAAPVQSVVPCHVFTWRDLENLGQPGLIGIRLKEKEIFLVPIRTPGLVSIDLNNWTSYFRLFWMWVLRLGLNL